MRSSITSAIRCKETPPDLVPVESDAGPGCTAYASREAFRQRRTGIPACLAEPRGEGQAGMPDLLGELLVVGDCDTALFFGKLHGDDA